MPKSLRRAFPSLIKEGGTPLSRIMKTVKRTLAAEYSRALSGGPSRPMPFYWRVGSNLAAPPATVCAECVFAPMELCGANLFEENARGILPIG